jgi:hypothetical protein
MPHKTSSKLMLDTILNTNGPNFNSIEHFYVDQQVSRKFFEEFGESVPGSSDSTVSGYGLDERRSRFDTRQRRKDFSYSLCVQTGSGVPPTQPPVQWVPGVLSPGLKRGWGMTLTTHPHLVQKSTMGRSYISSPPKRLRGV